MIPGQILSSLSTIEEKNQWPLIERFCGGCQLVCRAGHELARAPRYEIGERRAQGADESARGKSAVQGALCDCESGKERVAKDKVEGNRARAATNGSDFHHSRSSTEPAGAVCIVTGQLCAHRQLPH